MSDLLHGVVQWLGFALVVLAAITALGALGARSAFAMITYLAAALALGALALAAFGVGSGALGLAFVGVGIAPFLLMGAVLLSARASKRSAIPWVSASLGLAALAPVAWALADLREGQLSAIQSGGVSGLWLAAIMLIVACACLGLLGFGERGIMQRGGGGRP